MFKYLIIMIIQCNLVMSKILILLMLLFSGLWGLVNNAGIVGHIAGPPEWHTAADFQQVRQLTIATLTQH